MNNVLRIIRSWEAKGNSVYNLYDRLIPYLREENKPRIRREFLEEEIQTMLRHSLLQGTKVIYKENEMPIEEALKYLWEGQDKDTCLECAPWGSKGYKTHGPLGSGEHYDCPRCGGAREYRRSGKERRKIPGRRHIDTLDHKSIKCGLIPLVCHRRILADRRKK